MATRRTSREINRQIALSLIRAHQPVSRAELARLMETNRSNVTLLVNKLLEENLVREGAQGSEKIRGRKPTFLYLNSEKSYAVAVDVRASRTFLMITDALGAPLAEIDNFATEADPARFVKTLSRRVGDMLRRGIEAADCEGLGIVVPGMLDPASGVVINAPTLGWHDVNLLALLRAEFDGVEIHLENSAKACALAQVWMKRGGGAAVNDLVFVSVSDGVGVGIVIGGELVRGRHNSAGEFGHLPLSIDGPPCSCGLNGCLEAYISNPATIARYTGSGSPARQPGSGEIVELSIENLMARARAGDSRALTALFSTARYLGLGLASIINALGPSLVYIGGEITEAWDLIELHVRNAIGERTLTAELAATPVQIVPASENPRLRGAVALVTAPAFAAPKLA
jgi:predicted NBD/HSP70 family sugar kinase